MTPYQQRLTPVTKRMAEDMKIRHLAQSTIDAYTYHVGKFAQFLGKPLKKATPEDVRGFQLHLRRTPGRLEQLQSSRLWPTLFVPNHPAQALAGRDDPLLRHHRTTRIAGSSLEASVALTDVSFANSFAGLLNPHGVWTRIAGMIDRPANNG